MRFLYQLGSTWLHFGSKNLPKSRLGGVLGRLVGVLGHLGGVLGRLGDVLERLGRVLGRLGAENEPSWARQVTRALRIAALLGRWEVTISNEEGKLLKGDIQTDYRPLQTTLQQTQTRSWAPSGPVRIQSAAELRSRHRADL